jgi:para-nitrobenzyl esterase
MSDLIVETSCGKVRGIESRGVKQFRGVRYGGDMGGRHRFLPPRQPEPWAGVRDAQEFAAVPIQPETVDRTYNTVFHGLYRLTPYEMSEDCLFLNIWTGDLNAKRPVMVWIHPDGIGDSNWTDGANLARDGEVVYVQLNYRFYVIGHLHLGDLAGPEYADSGNSGILDIVAALQWIRDNIARFGGDPGNVTIFGESGGASRVCTLLAVPAAKGLFHKAIVQSFSFLRARTPEVAERDTARMRTRLDNPDLETLISLPSAVLMNASADTRSRPVVSGKGLPRHPFDPDSPAISADVALMVGVTKDELTYWQVRDKPMQIDDVPSLTRELIEWMSNWGIDENTAASLIAAYRGVHPHVSFYDSFAGIGTWILFDDAVIQAERKAAQNRAPVFMYRFDWASPAFGGQYRSCHTFEIPYAFGNLDAAPQIFVGAPDERHKALSRNCLQAWVAFAHNGNPSHVGIPAWKPYDLTERATMLLDYECSLAADPWHEDRLALEKIRPQRLAVACAKSWGDPSNIFSVFERPRR